MTKLQCGAYVRYEERRRKGSGKPYLKPSIPVTWWQVPGEGPFSADGKNFRSREELVNAGYVVCDGNVVATVKAEDEPYFGGASAVLAVSYRCDKCGNTTFLELPTEPEAFSALVTSVLGGVDRDALKRAAVEARNKHYGAPAPTKGK